MRGRNWFLPPPHVLCEGFAAEVAKELPSAVTIASKDLHVAHRVQDLLSTSRFRCYRTDDVAGTTACTCDT